MSKLIQSIEPSVEVLRQESLGYPNYRPLLENQDTCIKSPSLCNLDKPVSEPHVLPYQAPSVPERSSAVDLLNKVSLVLDAPCQFPYLPQRRSPHSQPLALGPDLLVYNLEGGNYVQPAASPDRPSLGNIEHSDVGFHVLLPRLAMPFPGEDP